MMQNQRTRETALEAVSGAFKEVFWAFSGKGFEPRQALNLLGKETVRSKEQARNRGGSGIVLSIPAGKAKCAGGCGS